MNNITSKTIIEVLDKLIGCIIPCGDSSVDYNRIDNLRTLIDITNWCLESIDVVTDCKRSYKWSVREGGIVAVESLMQFRDWLNDVLEDE